MEQQPLQSNHIIIMLLDVILSVNVVLDLVEQLRTCRNFVHRPILWQHGIVSLFPHRLNHHLGRTLNCHTAFSNFEMKNAV